MLSFMLTGTLGAMRCSGAELAFAISSSRILQSGDTQVRWVTCIARDQLIRSKIVARLNVGDIVRVEGEIEPRRRQIHGLAYYDVVFVARWFGRLQSRP